MQWERYKFTKIGGGGGNTPDLLWEGDLNGPFQTDVMSITGNALVAEDVKDYDVLIIVGDGVLNPTVSSNTVYLYVGGDKMGQGSFGAASHLHFCQWFYAGVNCWGEHPPQVGSYSNSIRYTSNPFYLRFSNACNGSLHVKVLGIKF